MLGWIYEVHKSGRDDSLNEDGNETTVYPEKNKSTPLDAMKSVNKLPEDTFLKTEFDN